MRRAKLCARDCGKKMAEIEAFQSRAKLQVVKRVQNECPPVNQGWF